MFELQTKQILIYIFHFAFWMIVILWNWRYFASCCAFRLGDNPELEIFVYEINSDWFWFLNFEMLVNEERSFVAIQSFCSERPRHTQTFLPVQLVTPHVILLRTSISNQNLFIRNFCEKKFNFLSLTFNLDCLNFEWTFRRASLINYARKTKSISTRC